MPYVQPTRGDVHVNRMLTQISIHFAQAASHFVASQAFRVVPVEKQSDRYFTYDRGEFNRDEVQKRAPGTKSAGGTYRIDNTPTYFADVYAFHRDVPDQIRTNADQPLQLDREAVMYLTTKMMIRMEVSWRDAFFTAGLWDTDFTPGTLWDAAMSTPISDVRTGRRTVLESTGIAPNVMICGREVYDALLDNADIIDRLNRGQTPVGPALANRQQLAAIFELDEVLVMDGIQNTALEGQTASHSFIGGKNALLAYRPPSPGIMTPAAGYTFAWTGLMGASALGTRIKRFRMEEYESDRIEIQATWDQKLVAPELGYFFEAAVS